MQQLDLSLVRGISAFLAFRDWSSFHSTCSNLHASRQIKRIYMHKTPYVSNPVSVLSFVLRQNDTQWLRWFLKRHRGRINQSTYANFVSSYYRDSRVLSMAMIDFDVEMREKAQAKVSHWFATHSVADVCVKLRQEPDSFKRLLMCRAVCNRWNCVWNASQSDSDLLAVIARYVKIRRLDGADKRVSSVN